MYGFCQLEINLYFLLLIKYPQKQLTEIDAIKSTSSQASFQSVDSIEKINHEKFASILAESTSNLSDLIGIHYLKVLSH